MEFWRVEKSWASALEGLLQLTKIRDELSTGERDKLNTAVRDWWYAAPEEKKNKIIEVMNYINELPRIKIKKGLFKRK
jgi:hypothetical protein